ncbi:MAG: DNA-binding protein [Streptococcaceae bacterium]|jgi:predicted DNA-binding protein YlxM (UPF0122 family)|nr:DNA-binding protein [Streptococcaceae bacterium]
MNDLEKLTTLNMLLDVYGALLSERELEIAEMYYAENLSLSEIGENLSVSRQSISQNLQKTEAKLTEFEEKLHLLKRAKKRHQLVERLTKTYPELTEALSELEN